MRYFKFLAWFIWLATVAAVILWLIRYPIIAAVVITGVVGLGLGAVLALVWSLSSWWTARLIERGAKISQQAQQINDAWDTRKTTSLVQLLREGLRLGRPQNIRPDLPSLPLPSQEAGWLPGLTSFNTTFTSLDDELETGEAEESTRKFLIQE